MAIKKISEFVAGTPTSDSKILFEQNEKGKSATISDAVNTCTLTYEEIMDSAADLTNKVASASSVKTLGDNQENWKSLSEIIYVNGISAFESDFKSAADYSMVTPYTAVGGEGGAIMFKHTSSALSYGIFFNKRTGAKIIKRNTDGTWYYRDIL